MEIQLGYITSDAIHNQINFKLSHWSYDIITNALFQEIVEFPKIYKGSPEQRLTSSMLKVKCSIPQCASANKDNKNTCKT